MYERRHAIERHHDMLARARQHRLVAQVRTLDKAMRRVQRAERRLVEAEVGVMDARTKLVEVPDWAA